MHSYHTFYLLSQANGGDEDVTFDVEDSVADKPAELKEAYGGDTNLAELDTNNSVAGDFTEDEEEQENGKEAPLVDVSIRPKKKKSEEKELTAEDILFKTPKKVRSTWKYFSW